MPVLKEKVRKIIKKATRFLIWTTGIVVLLCVALYFTLRSPTSQTWISQKLANYLSDELGTTITIGGVNIQFFTSVVLEELYVEDKHGDTLLHAPEFTVDITEFDRKNQYINLDAITLTDANIKIKKYKNEKGLNFHFIVDYFDTGDTTVTEDPTPWQVDFGKINLENVRFAFIDTRWDDVDRGVDYENIRVRNIFATFERIEPGADSSAFYLSELKAVEQSGFTLEHMESRMIVADTFIKFNDLIIQTPGSDVKGFLSFHFNSFADIEDDFIHRVKMQGHFSESVVELGDIAYFSPVMLGIQKKVLLTGDVSGTVEKLKTRNIDLRFGKRSRIAGNFSFDGLPEIESTDMHFRFKDATTNYEDLSGIPVAPFTDSSFLEVPSRIAVLGDMYFTGTLEGFIHDFVAHGKLRTGQGNLVLENLAMSKDSTAEDYDWQGVLSAEEFNIGAYLGVPEMGRITGTANMVGYGTDVPSMVASMNANFSAFEYNNYRYTNITVTEGTLAKEVFDGNVIVDDPNIYLEYNGFVDFVDTDNPKLEFTAKIDSANFSKLGFADTAWNLIVTTDMFFDMQGSNIDNLNGIMRFWDIQFVKNNEKYKLDALALSATPDGNGRTMRFDSDFLTASLSGQYELMKLPEAVTDVMTAYLPAYFPPRRTDPRARKKETFQRFNWTASFGRNTDVISAFLPKIKIAPNTYSYGSFNQEKRDFSAFVRSDSISVGNYEIKRVNFVQATGTGGKAALNVSIDRIQVNDTTGFDNVLLAATASSNRIISTLTWNNNSAEVNRGRMTNDVTFESEKSLSMKITEGEFTFNDSTWVVDSSNIIRRDSNVIAINNLVFRSGGQSIGVKGKISENPKDHLDVHLDGFNLSMLNYITEANGVTVSGRITGDAYLSNLYHSPTFSGDAKFDEVFLNRERLGDGTANAAWFPDKQGVLISSSFWRLNNLDTGEPIENIGLNGWYYPKNENNNLDLTLKLNLMPLGLLKPALADYCSKMVGYVNGTLAIKGSFEKPLISGPMEMQIKMVTVDYLGLSLTNSHWQKFEVTENSFYFDNFKISDNERDTATVYGNLYHDNFRNFQFDMDIAFDHFQVLNTTAQDNEDYYGRVYATGFMNIFGYADKKVTIDITAKTAGVMRNGTFISSDFNIPMSTASEAGENDFIVFRDMSDTASHRDSLEAKKPIFNDNGVELFLNLEATRDALVHVIFDETVGDELSARGNGDLRMHIATNGEFTMFGSYFVEEGDYMFTLKNIVYAPFELVKGGVLSWNGDPADARIDADAIYTANASVEPFFPYDSTTAAYQQAYPVNVIMHLDGQLVNPSLSFDIELPTADPNIQETVRSYTQSELEMNRQVLSLMVLNSFMTPSEFRDGTDDNDAAGAAGTTLLSNFVSGTLNNWLSQISDNANVKFKYRPNDDMSLQELKLALGTQLLNNRLTFDVAGNVTNASQTQTQGGYSVWGDVNVEYKVTEDGKVRLRAFNRGTDNTTDLQEGTQYSQGAGIFYREDFETFGELFRRWRDNITAPNPNRKPAVEAPPVVAPPDTIINKDTLRH